MTELLLASSIFRYVLFKTFLLALLLEGYLLTFLEYWRGFLWSAVLERPTGACASSTLCSLLENSGSLHSTALWVF